MTSWMSSYIFEVKAVLDNLVESDQEMVVSVSANILSDAVVHSTSDVGKIKVSHKLSYFYLLTEYINVSQSLPLLKS